MGRVEEDDAEEYTKKQDDASHRTCFERDDKRSKCARWSRYVCLSICLYSRLLYCRKFLLYERGACIKTCCYTTLIDDAMKKQLKIKQINSEIPVSLLTHIFEGYTPSKRINLSMIACVNIGIVFIEYAWMPLDKHHKHQQRTLITHQNCSNSLSSDDKTNDNPILTMTIQSFFFSVTIVYDGI